MWCNASAPSVFPIRRRSTHRTVLSGRDPRTGRTAWDAYGARHRAQVRGSLRDHDLPRQPRGRRAGPLLGGPDRVRGPRLVRVPPRNTVAAHHAHRRQRRRSGGTHDDPDGNGGNGTFCTVQFSVPFRGIDTLANVALLFPVTLFAGLRTTRPVWAVAAASGFSAAVELLQALVPSLGRACDTNDWFMNTVGAVLAGWSPSASSRSIAGHRADPSSRRGSRSPDRLARATASRVHRIGARTTGPGLANAGRCPVRTCSTPHARRSVATRHCRRRDRSTPTRAGSRAGHRGALRTRGSTVTRAPSSDQRMTVSNSRSSAPVATGLLPPWCAPA